MADTEVISQIQVLVTERCNIHCKHCAVPSEDSPADHELTFEQWAQILAAAAGAGTDSLVVNGGEALLRADALDLMEYALDSGMQWVSLITNGMLFTAPVARRVADCQNRYGGRFGIHVSIDGATASTHDWMRGDGTFDRVFTSVGRLRSAGGRVDGVNSVIHRGNWQEFASLARVAAGLGASSWTVFPNADLGRGRELADTRLSPQMWSKLIKQARAIQEATGMRVSIGGPVMNDEWPSDADLVPNPVVDRPDKLCLGPDGAAFTCPPLRRHHLGTYSAFTGERGWLDLSKRARHTLESACGSCKYLLVCTGIDLDDPLRPRTGPFNTPVVSVAVTLNDSTEPAWV